MAPFKKDPLLALVAPDCPDPDIKGWIQTYSGRRIWPLNPDPDRIVLEDIAHALSNVCRFTGHVNHFYSVAQHSVLVSQKCDPQDALWGLLHDASEAFIADVARPVKQHPDFAFYREAEKRLMLAVCQAFGLPSSQPSSVTIADHRMLYTERRDLLNRLRGGERASWGADLEDQEPYPEFINPLLPNDAETLFLRRFKEIKRAG